jgi:hypothetical protein
MHLADEYNDKQLEALRDRIELGIDGVLASIYESEARLKMLQEDLVDVEEELERRELI